MLIIVLHFPRAQLFSLFPFNINLHWLRLRLRCHLYGYTITQLRGIYTENRYMVKVDKLTTKTTTNIVFLINIS